MISLHYGTPSGNKRLDGIWQILANLEEADLHRKLWRNKIRDFFVRTWRDGPQVDSLREMRDRMLLK
jgi:hypothetical protein